MAGGGESVEQDRKKQMHIAPDWLFLPSPIDRNIVLQLLIGLGLTDEAELYLISLLILK